MMKIKNCLLVFFFAAALMAATVITKVSQFPQVTTPGTNDLFLLASGATNKNIKYSDLRTAIRQGVVPNSITTNALGTNLVWNPTFNILSSYGSFLTLDSSGAGVAAINPNGSAVFKGLTTVGRFQMTNGFFAGAILQSDATGEGSWIT